MDILTALDDRLSFIRQFYFTAAPPFEALMRNYTPDYALHKKPPEDEFENEKKWKEAYKGRETLALCCLSLVSKAIEDYLRHFILREFGKMPGDLKGNSPFEKYENFLLTKTAFRWCDYPIGRGGRDRIEQINLCRNDFIHDDAIDGDQPRHRAFRKQPDSRFIDPIDRAVQTAMKTVRASLDDEQIAGLGELAEIPEGLSLTATRELFSAIADARLFCAFVETKKISKQ